MEEKMGERVAVLEQFKEAVGREIGELKLDIKGLKTDIKEMSEKLLGRPSWAVSLIITFLTTICTGLIIYNITRSLIK